MSKGLIALTVLVLCSPVSALIISADADGYTDGTNISSVFEGMTLSSGGTHPCDGLDGSVYAYTSEFATTGQSVFGHNLTNHTEWYFDYWPELHHPDDFGFRVDFHQPANFVAIDIIASDYPTWGSDALIVAYNSSGAGIAGRATGLLPCGESCRVTIQRDSFDIAYVIVGGLYGDSVSVVCLDNLTANIVPEPASVLLLGLGGLALLRKRAYSGQG